MIYPFLRNLLFKLDPELVHHIIMEMLKLGRISCGPLLRPIFQPQAMPCKLGALRFRNPIGLGAGFDKNAAYMEELSMLGFGFVEIGTVTPKAQGGNPRPRLFRLPKDQALINRMGFNNEGIDAVRRRMEVWKKHHPHPDGKTMLIGGNIGKNKLTPNEDAWKDYLICFKALYGLVDFFVINVSSPNTPGLRDLQQKEALRKIIAPLQEYNFAQSNPQSLWLKIAPDVDKHQLDDFAALAEEMNLSAIVATNTTIQRENLLSPSDQILNAGNGGLSGKPLMEKSTEILRDLTLRLNGKLPVIASGGIFSGEDAMTKITCGASLLEIWTSFVYRGPMVVKSLLSELRSYPDFQLDHR